MRNTRHGPRPLNPFNSIQFSADVRDKLTSENLSLRAAEKQVGISHSTIKRAASGDNDPDIQSFGALCIWLRKHPDDYFHPGDGGNDFYRCPIEYNVDYNFEKIATALYDGLERKKPPVWHRYVYDTKPKDSKETPL